MKKIFFSEKYIKFIYIFGSHMFHT